MTLSSFISRVEEGEGADRLLDKAIDVALYPDTGCEPIDWTRRYTTSLDAVVSLIEQKLPGWEWLKKSPGVFSLYLPPDDDRVWAKHNDGTGKTDTRALLAATLRAIQSNEAHT